MTRFFRLDPFSHLLRAFARAGALLRRGRSFRRRTLASRPARLPRQRLRRSRVATLALQRLQRRLRTLPRRLRARLRLLAFLGLGLDLRKNAALHLDTDASAIRVHDQVPRSVGNRQSMQPTNGLAYRTLVSVPQLRPVLGSVPPLARAQWRNRRLDLSPRRRGR